MKKKILFTTLAIGLVGLFGFSFSQNGQQTKQVNHIEQKITKKQTRVTFSLNDFDTNNYYYFVAKNYSTNGEGVFYQDTISLDNSAIISHYASNYDNVILNSFRFQMINASGSRYTELYFRPALNSGVYKINNIYFGWLDYSNTTIYSAQGGVFNRNLCGFLAKGPFSAQVDTTEYKTDILGYINQFFNVYLLDGGSFTFNNQINYYAPYGQDIDTYFVNDSNMTSPSSSTTKSILENTPFYSGGLVFDTIRLRYFTAQALTYYDDNGNRQVWNANNFASYSWIEYVNSVTNRIIVVNQRLTQAWNEGNSSGVVQLKGSKWISTDYQHIQFFNTPTEVFITNLSTLNNSSYQGNTYVANTTDIGLGGAFGLISQAFTAWLPILSVSVLPGITLGMLIFLPLIAGIIILIIWIVKR